MKNVKKSIAKLSLMSALIFGSQHSFAIIPVTDIANLIESINGNLQRMEQWAEEKGMKKLEAQISGANAQLGVDNINNAIANVIVRDGLAKQEIQNIDIIEKSAPDVDSCGAIAASMMEKNASCAASEKSASAIRRSTAKHSTFKATPAAQEQQIIEIINNKVSICEQLLDSEGDGTISSTLCTRADIMLGSTSSNTFSDIETQAADEYIDLITGTVPVKKTAGNYDGADQAQKAILVNDLRREAFRSLINTSLNEIALVRKSEDELTPSVLDSLQLFDDERYGSEEWMASVGNISSDPSEKNQTMPSEVLRKIAGMDTFLVHMSMLQYKQQLRMEALLAGSLAYQIDPPK